MRSFSSYGPPDEDDNFVVPRTQLIEHAYQQLLGENPEKTGHYITVWAPRQAGKSWVMREILFRIREDERFDVVTLVVEDLKRIKDAEEVFEDIAEGILERINLPPKKVRTEKEFRELFHNKNLPKPLVLILDEFDALQPHIISDLAGVFRKIHLDRKNDPSPSHEKKYLLHGVALIGVRSVLGIENKTGSPFNIQRSVHIPNLTLEEVRQLFQDYQEQSGQKIDPAVIEQLYRDVRGQPGLICWFGELLTGTHNPDPKKEITLEHYEDVMLEALYLLPNNTIQNLISKANKEPYQSLILELFETKKSYSFRYDDPLSNFLFMNGVIAHEKEGKELSIRFASPFIQRRLFNYFSTTLSRQLGELIPVNQNVKEIALPNALHIPKLIQTYEAYFQRNRSWLLEDIPRRKDLRVFESFYHFNLFMYLEGFLQEIHRGRVIPEFPTGNGKIDLILRYQERIYGLELKSFTNELAFEEARVQAANYGKHLKLEEIYLVCFISSIEEKTRTRLEKEWRDKTTKVNVIPLFVETGT